MNIAYHTYQNTDGNRTDWCVHVIENGRSRLVFFGATKDDAIGKAKKWVADNLESPERTELLRKRAEERKLTAEKNKAKKELAA